MNVGYRILAISYPRVLQVGLKPPLPKRKGLRTDCGLSDAQLVKVFRPDSSSQLSPTGGWKRFESRLKRSYPGMNVKESWAALIGPGHSITR